MHNDETLATLHLGGIAHSIEVDAGDAPELIARLMTCGHGHVFVVDQSRSAGAYPRVRIGVSDTGLGCLDLEGPGL